MEVVVGSCCLSVVEVYQSGWLERETAWPIECIVQESRLWKTEAGEKLVKLSRHAFEVDVQSVYTLPFTPI